MNESINDKIRISLTDTISKIDTFYKTYSQLINDLDRKITKGIMYTIEWKDTFELQKLKQKITDTQTNLNSGYSKYREKLVKKLEITNRDSQKENISTLIKRFSFVKNFNDSLSDGILHKTDYYMILQELNILINNIIEVVTRQNNVLPSINNEIFQLDRKQRDTILSNEDIITLMNVMNELQANINKIINTQNTYMKNIPQDNDDVDMIEIVENDTVNIDGFIEDDNIDLISRNYNDNLNESTKKTITNDVFESLQQTMHNISTDNNIQELNNQNMTMIESINNNLATFERNILSKLDLFSDMYSIDKIQIDTSNDVLYEIKNDIKNIKLQQEDNKNEIQNMSKFIESTSDNFKNDTKNIKIELIEIGRKIQTMTNANIDLSNNNNEVIETISAKLAVDTQTFNRLNQTLNEYNKILDEFQPIKEDQLKVISDLTALLHGNVINEDHIQTLFSDFINIYNTNASDLTKQITLEFNTYIDKLKDDTTKFYKNIEDTTNAVVEHSILKLVDGQETFLKEQTGTLEELRILLENNILEQHKKYSKLEKKINQQNFNLLTQNKNIENVVNLINDENINNKNLTEAVKILNNQHDTILQNLQENKQVDITPYQKNLEKFEKKIDTSLKIINEKINNVHDQINLIKKQQDIPSEELSSLKKPIPHNLKKKSSSSNTIEQTYKELLKNIEIIKNKTGGPITEFWINHLKSIKFNDEALEKEKTTIIQIQNNIKNEKDFTKLDSYNEYIKSKLKQNFKESIESISTTSSALPPSASTSFFTSHKRQLSEDSSDDDDTNKKSNKIRNT